MPKNQKRSEARKAIQKEEDSVKIRIRNIRS